MSAATTGSMIFQLFVTVFHFTSPILQYTNLSQHLLACRLNLAWYS